MEREGSSLEEPMPIFGNYNLHWCLWDNSSHDKSVLDLKKFFCEITQTIITFSSESPLASMLPFFSDISGCDANSAHARQATTWADWDVRRLYIVIGEMAPGIRARPSKQSSVQEIAIWECKGLCIAIGLEGSWIVRFWKGNSVRIIRTMHCHWWGQWEVSTKLI